MPPEARAENQSLLCGVPPKNVKLWFRRREHGYYIPPGGHFGNVSGKLELAWENTVAPVPFNLDALRANGAW